MTLNKTSQCNKVDAVRLLVKFTFIKGSEVRAQLHYTEKMKHLIKNKTVFKLEKVEIFSTLLINKSFYRYVGIYLSLNVSSLKSNQQSHYTECYLSSEETDF